MVDRFANNPLFSPSDLEPSHPGLEVLCVFNPAATLFQKRRLLLLRVAERAIPLPGHIAAPVRDSKSGDLEIRQFSLSDPDLRLIDPRVFSHRGEIYLTSRSHFQIAESVDGVNFTLDASRKIQPVGPYESFGIEDARITQYEDDYFITYTAASERGVVISLMVTRDFSSFERRGILFGPDNKDVALFPEKIDDRYYALHRPAPVHTGLPSIWVASSENLMDWGRHELVIRPRVETWDCERVGAGSSPIRTPQGWLAFYHASDHNTRYCLGALLLDLEKPWKVLARTKSPFMIPEAPYETEGFMPQVIFHNGTIDLGNGSVELYYGGADLVTCGARLSIDRLLACFE